MRGNRASSMSAISRSTTKPARARGEQRHAGPPQRYRFLRHACRIHPHARQGGAARGVVRGPLLGGTIDGVVDYGRDDVHLRGTLVPLYGPNNLLGQIPVVGLFMGGDKEGLSASPMRSSAIPAIPCCASIRFRRWRRACCARCSNFPLNGDTSSDVSPRCRCAASVSPRMFSLNRLEQDVPLACRAKA